MPLLWMVLRDIKTLEQTSRRGGSLLSFLMFLSNIMSPIALCRLIVLAPVQQVVSALDGNVKLSYSGHRKVAYGIQMALLDNPLIQSVDFDYVD